MTHLRLYYRIQGGHVHAKLFSGKAKDLTHGKNGDLCFSLEEWADGGVREAFSRLCEVIWEGDRGALP